MRLLVFRFLGKDCITRCNTSRFIAVISLVMLISNSCNVCGQLTNVLDFKYPYKKKSQQIKSRHLAGQLTSPYRDMGSPENIPLISVIRIRPVWLIAPSYWNHNSLLSISLPERCNSAGRNVFKYSQIALRTDNHYPILFFEKLRTHIPKTDTPHHTVILSECRGCSCISWGCSAD